MGRTVDREGRKGQPAVWLQGLFKAGVVGAGRSPSRTLYSQSVHLLYGRLSLEKKVFEERVK